MCEPENKGLLSFLRCDFPLLNLKFPRQLTCLLPPVQINPQHSLPTLVDGELNLWESRAILMYLATKYDKSGKLYPADVDKRAKVDRILFFDAGTLMSRFHSHYMITVRSGLPIEPQKFKMVEEGVSFLETDLEGNDYLTGADLTIADLSCLATMYSYEAAGFPLSDYPNVKRWMEKCASKDLKYPQEVIDMLKVFFTPKK